MDTSDPYLPDICMECSLLPVQWFGRNNHRGDPFAGEKRLWAAAFEAHLDDWRVAHMETRLFPSPSCRARWRQELTEWLESPSEAPLTFLWYCDVLGIDPSALLKRLAQGAVQPVERTSNKGPAGQITLTYRNRRRKVA